jgi:hypothetical protein
MSVNVARINGLHARKGRKGKLVNTKYKCWDSLVAHRRLIEDTPQREVAWLRSLLRPLGIDMGDLRRSPINGPPVLLYTNEYPQKNHWNGTEARPHRKDNEDLPVSNRQLQP